MTSVLAFAVDAEKLRTAVHPAGAARLAGDASSSRRASRVSRPKCWTKTAQHIFASHPERSEHFAPVDERSFAIIFFDKELLEFAAPYEQHREIWGLRTSYGPQPIPEIVSASTRPQLALMIVLAVAMALGVFLVAGAAAREVRVAELKSNFVASVSHDLKTPLALIQLFAETLELGRVRTPERAQEYYRIINGESKKLTRLIENILDFSRMEAGLRPYRMEPADLGRVGEQGAGAHGDASSRRASSPSRRRSRPDLPRILADEGAAEQAIENLLANAMKYSGDAQARSRSRRRRANGHIVVSVTDHGIGISRREQGRIFRKFYRVQRELGGGPQGTGLGLAIVDHTMRGHGGFVRVESEPERGSTFSLHFPIPDVERSDRRVQGSRRRRSQIDETDSGDRGRAADAARSARQSRARRLRSRNRRRRRRGAAEGGELHARPGDPRRDAAEEERLRRLPRPARALDLDADRDADGALGGDRQGARPRARRRRLRHQAVLDHRAAGARARGAAPHRPAEADRRT